MDVDGRGVLLADVDVWRAYPLVVVIGDASEVRRGFARITQTRSPRRTLVVTRVSTGPGRGMVGLPWSPRGRRRCCTAGAASARRWSGCSRGCVVGRAGCWSCAASRGWQDGAGGVRDRVRVGVPGHAGGRCGVGDGAPVRGPAAVVRDDAGSAGPAACPSAGCARRGVRLASGDAPDRFFVGLAVLQPVGGSGRGATACVCG